MIDNYSFVSKSEYLRKKLRIAQKVIFFQQVWNMVDPEEKWWFDENNLFFYPTSEMGQITQKSVFLLEVSHIQLNYTFLVFWRFLIEIDWKLPF